MKHPLSMLGTGAIKRLPYPPAHSIWLPSAQEARHRAGSRSVTCQCCRFFIRAAAITAAKTVRRARVRGLVVRLRQIKRGPSCIMSFGLASRPQLQRARAARRVVMQPSRAGLHLCARSRRDPGSSKRAVDCCGCCGKKEKRGARSPAHRLTRAAGFC
jgi:hypothetical protein